MKFAILTNQRCGSHLLATLLDSHPELKVFDEHYSKASHYILPEKPIEELKDGEGMIIMYNHLKRHPGLNGKIKDLDKIIHLYRQDIYAQAISHLKIMKGLPPHEKHTKQVKLKMDEILNHAEKLKIRNKNLRTVAENLNAYSISYERITSGKSINKTKLPGLLQWLGVEDVELKTKMEKV